MPDIGHEAVDTTMTLQVALHKLPGSTWAKDESRGQKVPGTEQLAKAAWGKQAGTELDLL